MTIRRVLGGAASVCVVAAMLLGGSQAVAAEAPVPGDWYVDVWGLQESIDAGYDGSGVKVAVIDGQINPEIPTLQGANLTVAPSVCYDPSGVLYPATNDAPEYAAHGTNSVSLVVGSGQGFPGQEGVRGAAPGAEVTFYSAGQTDLQSANQGVECNDESGEHRNGVDMQIEQALDEGADIITIQIGAGAAAPEVVARAMREGVIILQSLANQQLAGWSDQTGGLAAANGVVGVQAIDAYGVPLNGEGSTDTDVDVAAAGVGMTAQGDPSGDSWETQTIQSGTSDATPFTAGLLAAAWSKYPEATGDQMIQSLIRNTGSEDHELARDDSLGYGIVSLRHMLREDATQYDDANPLIVDDRDVVDQNEWQVPRYSEIFPTSASPVPTDAPANGSPLAALTPLLVAGGVIGLVVLAGIVVLIVLLARRSNRNTVDAAERRKGTEGY